MSELGQKLIENVRAIAAEKPDFVYPKSPWGGCQYVRDEQPSCLIGHALWNAGLLNAESNFDERDNSAIDILARAENWDLSDDEVMWLAHAQSEQDNGRPWGRAVQNANLAVPV